jgi:diacylglycerol kinase family enzyme
MALIGRGRGVSVWLNPGARQVTTRVVDAFHAGLPAAEVIVATRRSELRAAAKKLARHPPALLLCGGGDGTAVTLLNALREAGADEFPPFGFLKLGTGNGWPRATGARSWRRTLAALPRLPLHPTTRRYNLLDVEGRLCHFAGVGWDAMVLHDFRRNLRRRERQAVGAEFATRLSKSVLGYLYSITRRTVPRVIEQNLRTGKPTVRLENLGEPALTLDRRLKPIPVPADGVLFDGPLSIAAVGTEPFWGGGFKAFPYATAVPGRVNVRVYDRPVLEGFALTVPLWQGRRVPGMRDYFLTRARLTFDRPVPFQVGGDVVGHRKSVQFRVADQVVDAVDWAAAFAR